MLQIVLCVCVCVCVCVCGVLMGLLTLQHLFDMCMNLACLPFLLYVVCLLYTGH